MSDTTPEAKQFPWLFVSSRLGVLAEGRETPNTYQHTWEGNTFGKDDSRSRCPHGIQTDTILKD